MRYIIISLGRGIHIKDHLPGGLTESVHVWPFYDFEQVKLIDYSSANQLLLRLADMTSMGVDTEGGGFGG